MASCTTTQWVSYAPRAKLEVTQTATTATTATLTWKLYYLTSGYAASCSGARAYTVTIGESTVKTGTYDINAKKGSSYLIASGTKTIDKTTSSQTISFGVSFTFNLTWSGVYGGTKTASGSITVAAKDRYTVSYNANGGTGAPSSQKKWHGDTLTLSSTEPTRTGYTFDGWATSKSGSKAYNPGASYTANKNITLYAVWNIKTYTVTYNVNSTDGSGAPSKQTKTYGVSLPLSSTKPTRTNYTFKGWGTSATTTTVSYAAGASYTANKNITLYAIWQLSYIKPRITNLKVARCVSSTDSTTSENGEYARVSFKWATDKTVSSVKIEWKLASDAWSTATSATVTASGTGATVTNKIIGTSSNKLTTEKTYSIRVTVTDASGSTSKTVTLGGMKFPIDLLGNGNGIAFGKPAEVDGYMDVGYMTRHRDSVVLDNAVSIYGKNSDDKSMSLLNVNGNNETIVGYGLFYNKIGATRVYGHELYLTSHNGIFVDGRKIATNKVLWSGEYYMNTSQTCTLTEAITAQANGIILVWSEYGKNDAGESTSINANFTCTFIPRRFVSSHGGKGVVTICSSATLKYIAAKYVYVSDTTITGYGNNVADEAQADCGVTTSPKKFVLRYVIGV